MKCCLRTSPVLPDPKSPGPIRFCGWTGSERRGLLRTFGQRRRGLRIDTSHLIWEAGASYDTARKSDDNTINNEKGHSRRLESSIYYRFHSGWFAGAGAGWTQLSTTNYSKQAFRPTIGGGKDYFHKQCAAEDCVDGWSMRWQMDYTLKGAEHVDPRVARCLTGNAPMTCKVRW